MQTLKYSFIIIVLACGLCCAITAVAQRETVPSNASVERTTPVTDATKRKRAREGRTFTKQLCSFQQIGQRFSIRFEIKDDTLGTDRFVCLENLQLERIAQAIQDRPPVFWWVDGTFTEYRGNNYILVQRAQLAPQSALETLTPTKKEGASQ